MRIFFDASALVKAYVQEDGTQFVQDLLALPADKYTFLVAAHIQAEVVSSFAKKLRKREIDDPRFRRACQAFYEDFPDAFRVVPVNPPLIADAAVLIRRLGREKKLTAADAIHLAAVLRVNRVAAGGETRFVCADRRLRERAATMGFWTVSPSEDDLESLQGQRELFD